MKILKFNEFNKFISLFKCHAETKQLPTFSQAQAHCKDLTEESYKEIMLDLALTNMSASRTSWALLKNIETFGSLSYSKDFEPEIGKLSILDLYEHSTVSSNHISHRSYFLQANEDISTMALNVSNIKRRIEKQLIFSGVTIVSIYFGTFKQTASVFPDYQKEHSMYSQVFGGVPYMLNEADGGYYSYLGPAFLVEFQMELEDGRKTRQTVCVTTIELVNEVIKRYPNYYQKTGYPHSNHDVIALCTDYCEREELPGAVDGQLTNIFSNPRSLTQWFLSSCLLAQAQKGNKLKGLDVSNSSKVKRLKELLDV